MNYRQQTEPSPASNPERGAGMAEYALLLTLIAVALIAGFGDLRAAIDVALDATIAAFP